jgi:hypothetical protein
VNNPEIVLFVCRFVLFVAAKTSKQKQTETSCRILAAGSSSATGAIGEPAGHRRRQYLRIAKLARINPN